MRDNEIVERIRSEANIVDIVSDYLRLRKTGKNWLGLCPFHDDKKPSFTVEPVRGIYKCFACGKGGNVFTFLMEKNNWTFPETLRNLAERYGIPMEENKKNKDSISSNEILTNIISKANKFYCENLENPNNLLARSYISKRGFTLEIIKKFSIGYALDDWDTLFKILLKSGEKIEDIEKAGLVIKRDNRNGYYDRFRGRLLFAIHSSTGKIVGFGARRLNEDDSQPKYINSPESPVYHKSKLLYGLFQAKDSIRKSGQAIIVEGYVDVISMHQAGVQNVVATCGTSLAKEHSDLLNRYAQNVLLVFDSDNAGEIATLRGINILLKKGIDVSVLRLPQGEDPDSFVRKFGAKEFERKIQMQSQTFLDFISKLFKQKGDLDTPEKKTQSIRIILESISLIPDQLKRQLYVQKFISDFHLNENMVMSELKNAREIVSKEIYREKRLIENENKNQNQIIVNNLVSNQLPDAIKQKKIPLNINSLPSAEYHILKIMCEGDSQIIEHTLNNLTESDFSHPVLKHMFSMIAAYYENQRTFGLDEIHLEELEEDMRELIAMLAIEPESLSQYWSKMDPELKSTNPWLIVQDSINKIKIIKFDNELMMLQDKLKSNNISLLDEDNVFKLIKEISDKRSELGMKFI